MSSMERRSTSRQRGRRGSTPHLNGATATAASLPPVPPAPPTGTSGASAAAAAAAAAAARGAQGVPQSPPTPLPTPARPQPHDSPGDGSVSIDTPEAPGLRTLPQTGTFAHNLSPTQEDIMPASSRPSLRIPLSSTRPQRPAPSVHKSGFLTGVPPLAVLRQMTHTFQSCLRMRRRQPYHFLIEVGFPVLVVTMLCLLFSIVEKNTTSVGGFDLYSQYTVPDVGSVAPGQILKQNYSQDLQGEKLWFSVDVAEGGPIWMRRAGDVFRTVVTVMLVRERFFERGGSAEWHQSEDMTRILCQGKNASGLPLAAVTFTRHLRLHDSCFKAGRRNTLEPSSTGTFASGIHYVIHQRDIPRAGPSFMSVRPYQPGPSRPYATGGLLGLQRALDATIISIGQGRLAALIGEAHSDESYEEFEQRLHAVSDEGGDSIDVSFLRYPPPSKEVADRLFNMSQSEGDDYIKQMLARDQVFRLGGGPAIALSWIMLFSMATSQIVKSTQAGTPACLMAMGMSPVAHGIGITISSLLVSCIPILFQILVLNETEALINIDTDLLVVYFLCYVLSVLGAAQLLAVFFTNPSHASVISIVIYSVVVAAGAAIAECDETHTGEQEGCMVSSQKNGASLLSPVAFILGFRKMILIVNDEGGQVTWDNIQTGKAAQGIGKLDADNFSISTTLGMMAGDAFLYFLLAWYASRVTQNGYKVYFPLQYSYWFRPPNVTPPQPVAPCEDYERTRVASEPGLSVRNLNASVPIERRFALGFCNGKRKVLDSIDLDLYPGQVVAILGSEGKSSFLRCLSGHLIPDGGDIYLERRLIFPALFQYQMNIGLCPQTDAFYESLTVYEHMTFVAVVKGIARLQVAAAVESMLAHVGLLSQSHRRIVGLSPGQKKKLQVAMAFLGNPRIVLLDEPTLDMDPVSVRQVRDVIRRFKKNRIVCLVTNSMQEAELVADRIVVFEGGRCRCIGSSGFLKKRFGCGYLLTIGKTQRSNLGNTATSHESMLRGRNSSHQMWPSIDGGASSVVAGAQFSHARGQHHIPDSRDVNPLHTSVTPRLAAGGEVAQQNHLGDSASKIGGTPTTAGHARTHSHTNSLLGHGGISPICSDSLLNRLRMLTPSAFFRELRSEIRMHIPLQCVGELITLLRELETPGSGIAEDVPVWSLRMNGLEDVYLRLLEEEEEQVACPYGHVMTEVDSRVGCHGVTGVQCTAQHQKKMHCFACRITLCAKCARQNATGHSGVGSSSPSRGGAGVLSPISHAAIHRRMLSEVPDIHPVSRGASPQPHPLQSPGGGHQPSPAEGVRVPSPSHIRMLSDGQDHDSIRSAPRSTSCGPCDPGINREGYTPPLRYLDGVHRGSPGSPDARTPGSSKIEGIPARFNSFWEGSTYQAYVESGDLGASGGFLAEAVHRIPTPVSETCTPTRDPRGHHHHSDGALKRPPSSFGDKRGVCSTPSPGSHPLRAPPHPTSGCDMLPLANHLSSTVALGAAAPPVSPVWVDDPPDDAARSDTPPGEEEEEEDEEKSAVYESPVHHPTQACSVGGSVGRSEGRTDDDILKQVVTDQPSCTPQSGELTPKESLELSDDARGTRIPSDAGRSESDGMGEGGGADVYSDRDVSSCSANSRGGNRYERFRPSRLQQVHLSHASAEDERRVTMPCKPSHLAGGSDGSPPSSPLSAGRVDPEVPQSISDASEAGSGDTDSSWVPVTSPDKSAGGCELLPHVIFTPPAPGGPSVVESLQVLVMLKRYKITRNNPRALFFHTALPLCFVVTGLISLKYTTSDYSDTPTLELNPKLIGRGQGVPPLVYMPVQGDSSLFNFDRELSRCEPLSADDDIPTEMYGACPILWQVPEGIPLQDVLTTASPHFLTSGASFEIRNRNNVTIWYNASSVHVLPAVLNLFTNALLQNQTPQAMNLSSTGEGAESNVSNVLLLLFENEFKVRTSIHSITDRASDNALSMLIFALLVSVGMAFLSSGFAVPVVNENVSGARLLQQTAGLSTCVYWLGHYIWDSFLSLGITVAVASLFVALDPMFQHMEELLALMSVTFLYLQASLFLTYFYSQFFTATWKAQTGIATVYLVAMAIPLILSVSMSSSGATYLRSYNNLAIFAINPLYSLVTSWLILAEYIDPADDITASPFYLVRQPLYGLVIQFFIGAFLLAVFEMRRTLWMYLKKKFPRPVGFYTEKENMFGADFRTPEEREEVESERKEVERMRSSSRLPQSGIVIHQLRKSYNTVSEHLVAVHSLDLYIPKGEIFALLGPTGAGKTTTANMLMGGLEPTHGSAVINGHCILTDLKNLRPDLGVCLQKRALIEELTVADHIALCATLKGIPHHSIAGLSDALMCTLDLHRYRYSVVGELGTSVTQRLSVLMAFIGRPQVLILDEPTAGMDVVGRKRVQRFMLSWLKQVRSVGAAGSLGGSAEASALHRPGQEMLRFRPTALLTTHSIDEAQLFSTRLGIIVKGNLRRLGRLRDLSRKYGKGWSLAVRTPDDLHAQTFTCFLKTLEPRARVTSGRFGAMVYHLPRDTQSCGIFRAIEDNRARLKIEDYTMSQLSLEEVFMKTVLNEMPKNPRPPPRLRVVMLVVGTRGDVQPFLALALGMAREGHNVRLASHAKFRGFVEEEVAARAGQVEGGAAAGHPPGSVDFFPLDGEPDDLMTFMVENPDLVTIAHDKIRGYQDMMYKIFLSCWAACSTPASFQPEVMIANPPVQCHVHIAEKLQIPLQIYFTMPYTTTAMYPHPFAATNKFGNRQTYYMVEKFIWLGLGAKINELRRRVLRLPEITNGAGLVEKLHIPQIYCMSEFLLQRPSDWGQHISMTGNWVMPPRPYTPPAEPNAFLAAGSPPIYVGFGSIVLQDIEAFARIIRNGIRRVLSTDSEARFFVQMPPEAMRVLDSLDPTRVLLWGKPVDHSWLFPRCRITVHHGGAGTVASSLMSRCPMLVVPFFGDQLFWGKLVNRLGYGACIHHKELNDSLFYEAVLQCSAWSVIQSTEEIGRKLREENGVQKAIEDFSSRLPLVETVVNGEVMTGWQVTCFENQRYYPLLGWTDTLLPGDPFPWGDRTGRQSVERHSFPLPQGWRWVSDWKVDTEAWQSDHQGFRYANKWEMKLHKRQRVVDIVRRRKWVRVRVQDTSLTPKGDTTEIAKLQEAVASLQGKLKAQDDVIQRLRHSRSGHDLV